MEHLLGPDLRTQRARSRVVHLRPDVAGQHHARIVEHLETQRILLPDVQQILQDRQVQLVLGAEVVMQIGTRQRRLLGDIAHRGAAVSLLGEHLFRGLQDLLDIAPTNLDLVVAHGPSETPQCRSRLSALPRPGTFRSCRSTPAPGGARPPIGRSAPPKRGGSASVRLTTGPTAALALHTVMPRGTGRASVSH
ncbi:hypothetical protein D9M69_527170 [compost metagenome]